LTKVVGSVNGRVNLAAGASVSIQPTAGYTDLVSGGVESDVAVAVDMNIYDGANTAYVQNPYNMATGRNLCAIVATVTRYARIINREGLAYNVQYNAIQFLGT